MSKRIFTLIACALLLSSVVFAGPTISTIQKADKPWTDWTQKDAEKILSSSPWAQTQVDTDTSEMFFQPTPEGERLGSGARNQAVNIKFIVRFFSARPIRRALVRMMELKQKPDAQMTQRLHAFADVKTDESIILTLTVETTDQRYSGIAMQAMNSAITATLKNETYLERDGKRLFLHEYVPPGKDGFGARFIFLRDVDGKPFIDGNSGDVRFLAKYPNGLKVDRRFKISDMMYDGAIEY